MSRRYDDPGPGYVFQNGEWWPVQDDPWEPAPTPDDWEPRPMPADWQPDRLAVPFRATTPKRRRNTSRWGLSDSRN